MSDLPAACLRVQAAADAAGLAIRIVVRAEATRTAEEAAAACGCGVAQIVKSLVFVGKQSGKPWLLLVSGANRVDEKGAARHLGEPLKRPDAAFVRELTGYAIGGIPPIGHPVDIATCIDPDLMGFPTVWAAAGTPNAVFEVDPRALAATTKATLMPMA